VLSTEELAARAEIVAVGQVATLASEWNENRTAIRTRITLSVDQYMKGSGQGASLTLYVPGGEVGTVGEYYSHMPVFRKDENVVVFVRKDRQNHLRVLGGEAGKFTIKKDPASGVPLVAGKRTLQEFTALIKQAMLQQTAR
jgi:hypothetical protein